jgi:tetratricopeptide (TPR) repeat protein
LLRQGRCVDSAMVLVAIERQFKDLICLENRWAGTYYVEKAIVLRIEGQLLESEEILRGILNRGPDHPTTVKFNALDILAALLTEIGRQEEAATLGEKLFFECVEMYGIAHKFTIWSCGKLGTCYTKLGRYDDAIYLYQQTIERLALIQGSETDFCNAYTQELNNWILWVKRGEERQRS